MMMTVAAEQLLQIHSKAEVTIHFRSQLLLLLSSQLLLLLIECALSVLHKPLLVQSSVLLNVAEEGFLHLGPIARI